MASYAPRPTHFLIGEDARSGMTGCGINGPGHRAVAFTRDQARVTCKRCLGWIARSNPERPPLKVTPDSDGGITVRDPQSDLVLSIIATHPSANAPKGVYVEVYDYYGKDVLMEDATRMKNEDGYDQPLRLVIAHHPTIAFYPDNER